MRVWICIRSSCHVRGSKEVIETLTGLVKENHVKAEIELAVLSVWALARRESAFGLEKGFTM